MSQEPGFSIPRTTPTTAHEYTAVIDDQGSSSGAHVELVSPVYDNLETNIPHGLMSYSDLAFPDATPLFPEHQTVLAYLQRYGRAVEHLVRFGTQVRDVRKIQTEEGQSIWQLESRDIKSGEVSTMRYDAVIAASGHYSDPFVPDVPGIAEFEAAHPESIIHSKFYRRPEQFAGKVSGPDFLSNAALYPETDHRI